MEKEEFGQSEISKWLRTIHRTGNYNLLLKPDLSDSEIEILREVIRKENEYQESLKKLQDIVWESISRSGILG